MPQNASENVVCYVFGKHLFAPFKCRMTVEAHLCPGVDILSTVLGENAACQRVTLRCDVGPAGPWSISRSTVQ